MHPELKAQIELIKEKNTDRSFIDPANFFESERNSGYKNTGNALYEIIDNSYEANAEKIFIVAKNKSNTNKPESIAVIDNGMGMPVEIVDGKEKDYLHTACKIGGTHRASANKPLKRKGYGRFGHGLPKSSISQTRSFTVYTRTENDKSWRALKVDIDELIKDKTTNLPEVEKIEVLPNYIQDCWDKNFSNEVSGTIVAWNTLDRMTWKTDVALQDNLGWRIAMSYWRNIKSGLQISLLGRIIKPIDPLFIDKNCQHVEKCVSKIDGKSFTNEIKAIEYQSWTWPFEVHSEGKTVTIDADVRLSRFPSNFGSKNSEQRPLGKNRSIRQKIMQEHNGILIYRQGRYIDCLRHIPSEASSSRVFKPYDSNYKVEINFPSSLDEAFGISTNKQYVNLPYSTVNNKSWDRLMKECTELYNDVEDDFADRKLEQLKNANAAVQAIDEADKVLTRPGGNPDQEHKKQRLEELASKNLEKVIDLEVERRKKSLNTDNVDKEKVRAEITPQYAAPKRMFEFEDDKTSTQPFFRIHPVGGVRYYYINKNHNFHKKIWINPNTTDFMRESMKLIISAIGEASLGATDEAKRWYFTEMDEWSKNLHITTDTFVEKFDLNNSDDLDDTLPN